MWAVHENNIQCVESLVNAKADLNKQDQADNTALTWAIYYNHTESAKLLIEAKADFELPKKGIALDYAMDIKNIEIICLLLCQDVLINNPENFVTFLRKQNKDIETTFYLFSLFYEQQSQLRHSNSKKELLLDEKNYNEVKSELDALKYPKELLELLKTQLTSSIDHATDYYFPFVLIDLIAQYDNQLHRLFTPKLNGINGFFDSKLSNAVETHEQSKLYRAPHS